MTPSSRPGSPTSRCRRASRKLALLVLFVGANAFPARASVRFEVGGTVQPAPDTLDVRVEVRNVGDQIAPSLTVVGELFGRREEGHVAEVIPPGRRVSVTLRFPAEVPRPGVHALLLRLEYPEGAAPDTTGNVPLTSEPAYLLLALGQNASPAVRIAAAGIEIDAVGALPLTLESADGEPHRVRLRVLIPRGLHADGARPEVDVPGKGTVLTTIALRRASAPRGSRPGVLVVAEAVDGPVARTTVAAAEVGIAREPGLLPRLRLALFLLGAVLIAGALWLEFRRAPA